MSTYDQISLDLLVQAGMLRMRRAAKVMLAELSGLMALLLLSRLLAAPRCLD